MFRFTVTSAALPGLILNSLNWQSSRENMREVIDIDMKYLLIGVPCQGILAQYQGQLADLVPNSHIR